MALLTNTMTVRPLVEKFPPRVKTLRPSIMKMLTPFHVTSAIPKTLRSLAITLTQDISTSCQDTSILYHDSLTRRLDTSTPLSRHFSLVSIHVDMPWPNDTSISFHNTSISFPRHLLSRHFYLLSRHFDPLSRPFALLSRHFNLLSRHFDLVSRHFDPLPGPHDPWP